MLPVVSPKKEDKKDNLVNITSTSSSTDNVSGTDNIDKDDFDDDVKDVTLGQFGKFVRLQDTLEKQIEKRSLRNQPNMSFGEKLGTKIEEKISDSFIDKMLGNMFTTGGTNAAKPDGWLAIVKTVLDSGFAQQAGAKLPETIEAMGKTFGKQKTDQIADAVVQAVGPKKSPEDEQRKMEEYVLSLNPVNVVDIKKFMELVNANPANVKVTDITQARNVLIEEQDRIRRDNPVLAESVGRKQLEENPDIDRGQRFPSSPSSPSSGMGQRDNFLDNMIPRDTNNMNMHGSGIGSSNQMTSEQILSLDPRDDASVTAYAWSQGHGQILQDKNGINKVRNILMRHQDDLTKQATGIGGSVEQSVIEQSIVQEQGNMKWDNEDIGKKGVGKMDKKGDISVHPRIENADSPVTDNDKVKETQSSSPSETHATQNSIMELLQKMANNFDNGVSELNNKLQMMENRINKIESQESQPIQIVIPEVEAIPENILVDESNIRMVMDVGLSNEYNNIKSEDQKDEGSLQEDQKIEDDAEEQEEDKEEEGIEPTESQSNIPIVDIADVKKLDRVHKKAPTSVLDESKEEEKEEQVPTKYAKGSMGWLKEQKRLKEQKTNKTNM